MQAVLNGETRVPKYHGQERLIAAEQVDEAKGLAHRRALKDIENRSDVSASHADTEKHLVGRVLMVRVLNQENFSIKESKQIATEAKKDGFDPEKYGIEKTFD